MIDFSDLFRIWRALAAVGICLVASPLCVAEDASFAERLAGSMSLGLAQDAEKADPESAEPKSSASKIPVFGSRGSHWWSLSASGMTNEDHVEDYSLRFSYHHFLAEDFEVNLALTAWFHDQEFEDEFSGSFDLGFRYHFLTAPDKRWTFYGDLGIGMMIAGGEVPEEGTDYNFTPRVAFGSTLRLPENLGGSAGGRLDLSVGWQHYSNASTSGSDDNPARDSLFLRLGVIFPF